MPWNDQNGGNGGSGGPWGSNGSNDGKKSGGSPWEKPPGERKSSDLEDQLRKVQDRFRSVGRGGGSGGSGGGSSKGLGAAGAAVIVGVAAIAWLGTGVVMVGPSEQASVFQFGEWKRNLGSGIHVHLPVPIETHQVVLVEDQREARIGETRDQSLMLTEDENIADVQFSVFWKVKTGAPQDFILNVEDPAETVNLVAESVMREVVGKSQLQQVITTERAEAARQVKEQTQALLDQYEAGIDIIDIQIARGDPPQEVIEAFNDVNVAEQDADGLINEATRYANQVVPEARGQAQRILQQAEGYRDQVIADATGEASRFTQILDEYRKAPRVTRERMYLETMERVLERTDKLILDNDSGAVPYLPLDRRPLTSQDGR